jgi:hypothetical protein
VLVLVDEVPVQVLLEDVLLVVETELEEEDVEDDVIEEDAELEV